METANPIPDTSPSLKSEPEKYIFYHTIDLPDGSNVPGMMDLRQGIEDYFGHVSFQGRRVLDVGTASGFLSFSMEKLGAREVISFELDDKHDSDAVPYPSVDLEAWKRQRKVDIRKLNAGYLYCHSRLKSKASLIRGTVYDLPPEIGTVDISVIGCLLLHLENPWRAVVNVSKITKQSLIIVEPAPLGLPSWAWNSSGWSSFNFPFTCFLPARIQDAAPDLWWLFTPPAIKRMVEVAGFEKTEITFHNQLFKGKETAFFTVVAHR